MTTTVAPELPKAKNRPTLRGDRTHTTHKQFDAHPFDPTQGRKIGSNPYDDPARAR